MMYWFFFFEVERTSTLRQVAPNQRGMMNYNIDFQTFWMHGSSSQWREKWIRQVGHVLCTKTAG